MRVCVCLVLNILVHLDKENGNGQPENADMTCQEADVLRVVGQINLSKVDTGKTVRPQLTAAATAITRKMEISANQLQQYSFSALLNYRNGRCRAVARQTQQRASSHHTAVKHS